MTMLSMNNIQKQKNVNNKILHIHINIPVAFFQQEQNKFNNLWQS